jgi:hypothetical protein
VLRHLLFKRIGIDAIGTSVGSRLRYAAVEFGSAVFSCCDRKPDKLLSIRIQRNERDDYIRGFAVLKPLQSALQELHNILGIALRKIVVDVGNALSGLLDIGCTVSKIEKRPVELLGIHEPFQGFHLAPEGPSSLAVKVGLLSLLDPPGLRFERNACFGEELFCSCVAQELFLCGQATFVWALVRRRDELMGHALYVVKSDRNGQTYLPDDESEFTDAAIIAR